MSANHQLNPAQFQAVTAKSGPVLVLAGPGSGKTRVVTARIKYLIDQGVSPLQIVAVTFTNKAAKEMQERVYQLTKYRVLICTFHSFALKVLREAIDLLGYPRNFTIYDEEDVEKVLKSCLAELNIKKESLSAFRSLISQIKNSLQTPQDLLLEDHPYLQQLPALYHLYQNKLKLYQALDFDDLLFLTCKLWQEHPDVLNYFQARWPFLLIDEYQDTNHVQYKLAHFLVQRSQELFAVGDPDQLIYSWRGANIENILHFERDFPGALIIRLEQNYRSHQQILQVAQALIVHNQSRYEKKLWSELAQGEKIQVFAAENERQEAQFVLSHIQDLHTKKNISFKDIVVFYRTNAQSRALEDVFLHAKIPYIIVGGISFYQRKEIKDILAFLRMAQSDADFISFARTINIPKRGFGQATIEKIKQNAYLENLPILDYCQGLVENKNFEHSSLKLNKKQAEMLTQYLLIIQELRTLSKQGIQQAVRGAVNSTGYFSYLLEDSETYEERKENVEELVAKAVEWEEMSPDSNLETFLAELSLKSTLDESSSQIDHVVLMTIHNGKGLEYRAVFLIGLEEDLFPHIHAKNQGNNIEEERRLCYVGITRAKEYLYLTHCHTRYMWNQFSFRQPSRFLKEIPSHLLQKVYFTHKFSSSLSSVQAKQVELLAIGDQVSHPDFGIGQILEISQSTMGPTYKILFAKNSYPKTLLAEYAPLTKFL